MLQQLDTMESAMIYKFEDRKGVLQDMTHEIAACNEAHGWNTIERTFGDDVALLHSEVSEALEAWRRWEVKDATKRLHSRWDRFLRYCFGRELPSHKPEGIGSELADVLIRLLDTCDRYGVDLAWEFERKVQYNWSRPYRHGGKKL